MPKSERTSFTHSELVAALQRERTRTLAILGTFLSPEGVPPEHKELIGVLIRRIDGRDVIKVMHDEEPVIQHQPDDKTCREPVKLPPPPFEKRVHRSILTESQRAA